MSLGAKMTRSACTPIYDVTRAHVSTVDGVPWLRPRISLHQRPLGSVQATCTIVERILSEAKAPKLHPCSSDGDDAEPRGQL
jgi:hypothetical protein